MRKLSLYNTTKRTFYLFFFFIILCPQKGIAQENKKAFLEDSIFQKFTNTTALKQGAAITYYIATWKDAPPTSIKIVRQLAANVAIVALHDGDAFKIQKQLKMAVANDNWKLTPSAEQMLSKNKNVTQSFILASQSIDALIAVLTEKYAQIKIQYVNRPSNAAVVKCSSQYLKETLLPLKEVIFIDVVKEAHNEAGIIGYNRSFHGINAVDYRIPGANGKNIVAGIKEQGIDERDIDIWKRILPSPLAAPAQSYHATIIASIIGGAGNSSYEGRGIAWGCTFFPSSFSNLFADDAAILNSNRVSVQNHSYGTAIQQFYGAEAVSYDALAWLNKSYIAVMSAGNQGDAFATDGQYANLPGYANLTGNFKMAKNIITVGAMDKTENIPAQSSAGPLYDGRLAPQLTAHGPNGTSDAAAIVSGTIAVMQQVYADSNNGTLPQASLIKAILYNTADDIYNKGIDYKTGYGLLNSYAAIKAVQQKYYDEGTVSPGQQWKKTISVPANAANLKVTLSWTDSIATLNNNKALINDLDLEVTELKSGIIYHPWVLSTTTHIDSLAKAPVQKRDSLNTAEQVSIQLPAAGNYEISVKGTTISSMPVPFHIAYNTDTLNTFYFTSPQHASDVNRAENEILTIRWKTFVRDSQEKGDLYISYDDGTNWQMLEQSVSLTNNKHQWYIKDTSSIAVLKMQTGFGSFLSNRFVISPITKPAVDFNCVDSFRLSWNKHIYASGYKLYALTESPYLEHLLTVTDTFIVLNRAAYPSLVYAVEPVLSNGVAAARSPAVNINMQGVQCFYKTLNYNVLDYNKINLLLELSVATYADSVFFDEVTATGQFLQTYGGQKASNNSLHYTQMIVEVPAGITYFRSRIKLKNGAFVYTDIIPVLTSGKKSLLFYPNPASRTQPLNYVLQQGIPTSSKLQLFDANGRLLKNYTSMPGTINISAFSPGVVIYKLLNSKNETLETGKIIIR